MRLALGTMFARSYTLHIWCICQCTNFVLPWVSLRRSHTVLGPAKELGFKEFEHEHLEEPILVEMATRLLLGAREQSTARNQTPDTPSSQLVSEADSFTRDTLERRARRVHSRVEETSRTTQVLVINTLKQRYRHV